MSTEFTFETVFEAPGLTADAIGAAYFDPDHLAAQDVVGQLGERAITEDRDDDKVRFTRWSVRSLRPLPALVKPFVAGGRLEYIETMTWRKADREIDMTIVPQIAGGRVQIAAVYTFTQVGEGKVRRRYKGTIQVNVTLLSGKIERAILSEIEKGMPAMANCTQTWLASRGAR
jgi:hypothetical protein